MSTFDTKGDAWARLGRERELIDHGTWTPPIERHQQSEEDPSYGLLHDCHAKTIPDPSAAE